MGSRKQSVQESSTGEKLPPFLRFPGEIRNRIYSLALRSENVSTQQPNPGWEIASESEPFSWTSPHTIQNAVSIVDCYNPWRTHYQFALPLLSTNRQISREASAVFAQNQWVYIVANTKNFAAELRDKGFPVYAVNRIQQDPLDIFLCFEAQRSTYQIESFVIPIESLKEFVRVITLTVKNQGVNIQLVYTNMVANFSARKYKRLQDITQESFSQLRGVQRASVSGLAKHDPILCDTLPRNMKIELQSVADVCYSTRIYCEVGMTALVSEHWQEAEAASMNGLSHINDYIKVNADVLYIDSYMSASGRENMAELCLMVWTLAMNLAYVRIKIGKYESAAQKARYAVKMAGSMRRIRGLAYSLVGLAELKMGHDMLAAEAYFRAADDLGKRQWLSLQIASLRIRFSKASHPHKATFNRRFALYVAGDRQSAPIWGFVEGTRITIGPHIKFVGYTQILARPHPLSDRVGQVLASNANT